MRFWQRKIRIEVPVIRADVEFVMTTELIGGQMKEVTIQCPCSRQHKFVADATMRELGEA